MAFTGPMISMYGFLGDRKSVRNSLRLNPFKLLVILLVCIGSAISQHLADHHYSDHGGHEYLDSAHGAYGHGHQGSHEEIGDVGYAKRGHHAVAAHKAYGGKVAEHDSHQKHHDKGYYERNKGYGYEKAYAYDKIKSHHDKGSSHDSHGYQHAHHGSEGSHKLADDSAHGYSKYAKKSHQAGQGYSKHGKTLGNQGAYHHSYDSRGHQAVPYHGHEQVVAVAHSSPVYGGPGLFGYLHRKK